MRFDSGLLNVLCEIIRIGSIIILSVEFRVLAERFLNIKNIFSDLSKTENEFSKFNGKIKKQQKTSELLLRAKKLKTSKVIQDLIDQHNKLLEIRNEMERMFAPIFLINFLFSLIRTCMGEFNAIVVESVTESSYRFILGILQCILFSIQCYYCQQLKNAGAEVCDAIYSSEWEQINDTDIQKSVKLLLIRSQRSVGLTCWKFAENNFELFGSV